MRSTDGGESAQVTTTITTDQFLHQIEFSDPSTGWMVGSSLYKSFDGGMTWAPWPRAADGTGPGDIAFSNGRIFMAGGMGCEARLYASFFEPPEWELVSGFRYGGGCAELRTIDALEHTIVASGVGGNGGVILVSQDGGASFNSISFPNEELTVGQNVAIADETLAYVSGYLVITSESLVLATTDGGATWVRANIANMAWAGDILFTSPQRGYMEGAINGANASQFTSGIFVTSDGGQTWEFHPFPGENGGGQRLFAAPNGTLYAAGNGLLYRGWFPP
jgi:photosystem II stability/assembly factor-like uncharacterized protein